jgi:predicted amidohydrolase YtcJ
MYTINAARAGGHDRDRGSIEAGKLADLVMVDRNPLAVPPAELLEAMVTMTILDGQVVWEA